MHFGRSTPNFCQVPGSNQSYGKQLSLARWIVGSVVAEDGTFASTAQFRDRLEFVSPVASEPNRLSDTSLAVKIGPDGQEITVDLVTTLVGPQIF